MNWSRLIKIRKQMFTKSNRHEDYDVVVIGGGSGGASFANTISPQGVSVKLFDYVKPSPHGNSWGFGGTCPNVGCIPKKLFHIAAGHQANLKIAENFGFSDTDKVSKLTRAQFRAIVRICPKLC